MTYADLLEALQKLTVNQLSCDLTVELGLQDEWIIGELRICNSEHGLLDENHPVIYVDF